MKLRLAVLGLLCLPAFAEELDPVCVVPPVAEANSTMTVRVWFRPLSAAKPEFKWLVPARLVKSQDGYTEWEWDLKGLQPGPASTVVKVLSDGKTMSCGLEVRIVADLNSPEAQRGPAVGRGVAGSGRDFIHRGPQGFGETQDNETQDKWGLYSYILFATEPSPADYPRYLAFFTAIENRLKPLHLLEGQVGRNRLNATRMPVLEPPKSPSPDKDNPTPEWLVKNYDYVGATALLIAAKARLGIDYQAGGIYILSLTKPLTGQPPAHPVLFMDLSKVPAGIANTWIDAFLHQAMAQDFSDTRNVQYFAADLRKIIEITASVVPQVQSQIGTILKFLP